MIRGNLLERRATLMERIAEIEQSLRAPMGCTADASDVATDLETRSRMVAEQDRCARQVGEIDTRLAALRSGAYGHCECGEPIGAARLRANPLAALCVECASERERKRYIA